MKIKHTLKVTKAKELNEMSNDELRESLAKLKEEKISIESRNKNPAATPLAHPSGQARQNRKTIARIMTVLVKRGQRCV